MKSFGNAPIFAILFAFTIYIQKIKDLRISLRKTMKNKKHKIFLYPIEENGLIKVLLFQSGNIDLDRGRGVLLFRYRGFSLKSIAEPATNGMNYIYVNGVSRDMDFTLPKLRFSDSYTKEEFAELKELEYAYNNR